MINVVTGVTLAAGLLGWAVGAQGASLPDPLAPAAVGQVQCYSPNPTRKTCQSIALYARGADGRIVNTAIVLIAPSPVVVMESASPVDVRDGAVCGTVHSADLDVAKYTVNGQAIGGQSADALRQQLRQALAPVLEREVCTRYAPDGDALAATATLDGVAQPALSQRVIWVSQSDGWRVAP